MLTRFHPDSLLAEHLGATDNGVNRSPYWGQCALFRFTLAGGFRQLALLETLSQRSPLPVGAHSGYSSRSTRFTSIFLSGRNRARTYDLCDVNAVL